VTGVCSTKNIKFAKQTGADAIIDYTKEDVLTHKDHYDIFFDVVANQPISQTKKTLKSGGFYLTTLPSFQSVVVGKVVNLV